jgi:hypothetical protein
MSEIERQPEAAGLRVILPLLVLGAMLSISCVSPRTTAMVVNRTSEDQEIRMKAHGSKSLELQTTLPPGGSARAQAEGDRATVDVWTPVGHVLITSQDERVIDIREEGVRRRMGRPQ